MAISHGKDYKVKLVPAKIIDISSKAMIPVYNTILHKIQKEMGLIQVRDSYYNVSREKKIPMHGISVWPGYTSTIADRVGGLMLMVDLSFKVLRNQNVLALLKELTKQAGDVKNNALRALVGTTIMTRYNNKNYRIDDIAWDMNPTCTFSCGRNGEEKEITYAKYMEDQYQLKAKDLKQPLLVNRPKRKTQRQTRGESGQTECIYLIPEFCHATGLTDKMRCDFKVMQELAKTTRVKPDVRNEELQAFLDQIHKSEFAVNQFSKWGLELAKKPIKLTGRNINKEKLILGNKIEKPINPNADFSGAVTKSPMIEAIKLKHWVIFYSAKDEKKVNNFM